VLATSHGRDISSLPADVQRQIRDNDVKRVSDITGASEEHIRHIAAVLHERAPSLVLAGATAEGQENGYDNVAAAMTLNLILGNVGRTIESSAGFPFSQLRPRSGSGRGLAELAQALSEKRLDVLFIKGANPVFTAPAGMKFRELLANVPFKVAFSMFEDETTQLADLVLPLYSHLEDWGTHVPAIQPERMIIALQQPVMAPLYPDTRGFGDLLLSLLSLRGDADYAGYEDYYAYLQHAFVALPASLKGGAPNDRAFWSGVLQKGQLELGTAAPARLAARPVSFEIPDPASDDRLVLLPTASPTYWDGRHANVPWLQELPDPISKAVWDSWAELHPSTAKKLGGVETGDVLRVSSDQGSFEVRAYVYKGMHPGAIAIPVGQGHEAYGRYAQGRGVNPYSILADVRDRKTGELALSSTRVNVSLARKIDRGYHLGTGLDRLVVMGGSETQVGRKLVVTVTADRFERTEGRSA
jgi:anaerobic selenocysteine-containing dehydrogenase